MPKDQLWTLLVKLTQWRKSVVEVPHWARMPCQYLMRFQLHHSSKWACRTWLEVFIKYLTAFQNCLLPKLDILSKWFFFDCLSSCTTSFLNSTYLNHREEWPSFSVGAVSLPNRSFDLFIQGRFRITVWTNISWLYIPQVSMYAILLLTFHLVAWSTETALNKQKSTIRKLQFVTHDLIRCIYRYLWHIFSRGYLLYGACRGRREIYWFVKS